MIYVEKLHVCILSFSYDYQRVAQNTALALPHPCILSEDALSNIAQIWTGQGDLKVLLSGHNGTPSCRTVIAAVVLSKKERKKCVTGLVYMLDLMKKA